MCVRVCVRVCVCVYDVWERESACVSAHLCVSLHVVCVSVCVSWVNYRFAIIAEIRNLIAFHFPKDCAIKYGVLQSHHKNTSLIPHLIPCFDELNHISYFVDTRCFSHLWNDDSCYCLSMIISIGKYTERLRNVTPIILLLIKGEKTWLEMGHANSFLSFTRMYFGTIWCSQITTTAKEANIYCSV